jgi:hypothetical protein
MFDTQFIFELACLGNCASTRKHEQPIVTAKFDLTQLDFVRGAEDSVTLYGVRSLVEIKTGAFNKTFSCYYLVG